MIPYNLSRVGMGLCGGAAAVLLGCTQTAVAQQLAFSEAEGFGRFATGARTNLSSATVYHVTNLNDSGPGSFRDAVSQPNRFVVFDVGGIVTLQSNLVVSGNITIAGQTAPGGFTLYGDRVSFTSANNLISRYVAIRKGYASGREDAAGFARGTNMIFDHMSFTWGSDGTFDINPDSGHVIDNITIQNSVIGQGLDHLGHSTGGLMTLEQGRNLSVIKSLFIDNVTRSPKVRGNNEYLNNVVYGWETAAYIMGDTVNATSNANVQGNYFIRGPQNSSHPFTSGTNTFNIYANDNYYDSNRNGVLDGTLVTSYPGANVVSSRHSFPTTSVLSAQDALEFVLNNVGVSITRDTVDSRLVEEVRSYGTLGGVIARENELFPNYGTDAKYLNPRARLVDADNDGIPDNWETSRGLNPNNAGDWKNVTGGYTQLEHYVNELGGYGATRATSGGTWTNPATWGGTVPSFADTAIVTGGLAHASGNGFARRLTLDGSSVVSGGTLDVFDTVLVGAGSNGSLDMTGGTLSAGRLVLGAAGRTASLTLGAGSVLQTGTVESGGGTATLTFNGGTFKALAAPNIAVSTAVGSSGATINTNGFNGSITGGLSGSGTITKNGNGTLTLGGNNSSYSGNILLNAGQITLATNAASSSTGPITLANGTQINVTTSGASTPIALANGAAATIAAGGLTFNGAVTGAAGTTLSVNTSSGGTSNFSFGGSLSSFAGNFNLTGTGNIRIGSSGSSLANFNLGNSTGTIRTTSDGTVNFGSLSGGASTRLQGSTNGTTTSTYVIGANGANTTFGGTITDGTNTTPALLNITKTGNGTLTLSNNASTYTGSTRLSGGVLSVSSINDGGVASGIGQSSAAASSLVFDGGTLRYTGGATQIDRTFTLTQNGGTIEASGSNAIQFRNGGTPIALAGNGNRTLTLGGANTGWNTLDRHLSDPAQGTTSLRKTGNGTWRLLNTSSDFSGGVTIDAGTLIAWNSGTLPSGNGRGNISINGTGVLDTNGVEHTINGLNGNGAILHPANTRTLTLGAGNADGEFAGSFNVTGGALNLNKIGTGTQTISSNSPFSGTITVSGGKLIVNSTLANSPLNVGNSSTLGGSGTVYSVMASGGSTVSPGNSIGVLTVQTSATLGGALEIEMDGTGAGSNDRLDVAGQLDLTNTTLSLLTLPGGLPADGDVHVIASYGSLIGTFANVSNLPAGYTINYAYEDGTGAKHIALQAIPEPTSLGLLSLVAGSLLRRRM